MTNHGLVFHNVLRREIEKGGKLDPCPRCGVPRLQRSSYIRCAGCALNWMPGENLDRDPRIERFEKMKAGQTRSAKVVTEGRST